MRYRIVPWLACLLCAAFAAQAQQADPHLVYERKCGTCHAAHAGDFVWEALTETGDGLAGRVSGRPVRDMLLRGHGGLTAPEIDSLLEQFARIRQSGQLFRRKCVICHDSAVQLARRELALDGDRLVGRYTGRDIAAFLIGHGRLDRSEVTDMIAILRRALDTRAPAE